MDRITSTPIPQDDLDLNIAAFRRSLDAADKAKKTIRLYADAANDLARFLREQGMPTTVRNIRREHVEMYLVSLRERGLQPSTRNQTFRCLQAFWKYLVSEDEVKDSPLRNIPRPKIPETPPDRVTPAQMNALLDACKGTTFEDRRDTAIMLFFFTSGMRLAELAGLTTEDMDYDRKQARVTGKFHRTRDVRYGRRAGQALDRYLRSARSFAPATSVGAPTMCASMPNMSCSRAFITAIARYVMSMPIHFRGGSSFCAATSAVPQPQKGSSTMSPGLEDAEIIRSNRATGFWVG